MFQLQCERARMARSISSRSPSTGRTCWRRSASRSRWTEQQKKANAVRGSILSRMATLTLREVEVMRRVVAGQSNKVIAIELEISVRTVEGHRARVMEKMEVRTVAQLVLANVIARGYRAETQAPDPRDEVAGDVLRIDDDRRRLRTGSSETAPHPTQPNRVMMLRQQAVIWVKTHPSPDRCCNHARVPSRSSRESTACPRAVHGHSGGVP